MKHLIIFVLCLTCSFVNTAELTSVSFSKTGQPAGKIKLTFTWNGVPDLITFDEYNRAADAFQLFVHPGYSNTPVGIVTWSDINWSAIVRCIEFPNTNVITVRSKGPYLYPPELTFKGVPYTNRWRPSLSGGWGTNRGSYTYTLNSNILTVVIDSWTLGVNGPFSIYRGCYHYGKSSSEVNQLVNITP